uniref:Uncharacterized protein n=1 Tax=Hemileccinum impolitum TaxID=121045 RepID=A0A8F0WIQ0_9AGAM|nr:hypothetical protein KYX09_mgp15 [Xerocomus impolitus]QWM94551.1 hypothetical protein [Xerocomus impolitus]QWM97183.1 hypothetical protein [Xerocomus impolitus]UHB41862.1 hypothetical protein [Xerocomus impolitus]
MNNTILFKQRRSELIYLDKFIRIAIDELFDELLLNKDVKWIKIYILFTGDNNEVFKKYIYIKDNPQKISKKSYILKIQAKLTIFNNLNNKDNKLKEFQFSIFYVT